MPCSHLILLGCFAGTHQISQGLGTFIRNPYRCQISGSITTCQLLSIPPIRLYPITRLDRYQRGRHNLALDAEFCQLPVHHVARWSCLITGSQLLCRASFLIILRIDSARFGIVPRLRTSPSGSAIATAIVSAWTSNPKNRNFYFMTGSLALVALNWASF